MPSSAEPFIGLCFTEYRHQAKLWDDALDAGQRNAKGETSKQREERRDKARQICDRCPLNQSCDFRIP